MKNLLKLEFRKLKRQRSFYIILAIMLAFLVISALTMKVLENFSEQLSDIGEEFGESFTVSGSGLLLGFLSNCNFALLTAIFVAIVVCDDYDSHIVKNIFSRGYSRSDFYFAKLIYVIVTTSIMFVAAVAVSAVLSEILFGLEGNVRKMIYLISAQYLASLATVSLYFALCTVIKKLGASIAANIIAPSVAGLLLTLLDQVIKSEDFRIADYWVSSLTNKLSDIAAVKTDVIVCSLLAVAYFVVFTVVGYVFSERSEA